MRRTIALAAALAATLALPAAASAYSTPSGLTPSSSLCSPRPSDPSSSATVAFSGVASSVGSAGITTLVSGTLATSGPYDVYFQTSGGNPIYALVQIEDSSGTYHTIYDAPAVTSSASNTWTVALSLPAGGVRLAAATTTGTDTVSGTMSAVAGGDDLTYEEQQATDGCYLTVQDAAQAHSDAGSIASDLGTVDGDVKSTTSAVNGLTAGGVTLQTLDSDLKTLDTDVKATTAAVEAIPSSGGSGGSDPSSTDPQLVEFSSADRQLEADQGAAVTGDLWVIVGAIVGVFVSGVLLWRLLP